MFSYEYCEIFKNTFFYKTPLVAVSAMYKVLFCAILAQADQNKIVLRANIAQVIFLCNVVSDVFGQHEYTTFLCRSSRPEVFCKKGVLKNLTKFTEKHLCHGLFLNKLQA